MEYETLTGEEIKDVLAGKQIDKIKTLRYRKKNVPKRLYRNCKPMFQAADRQAAGSSITWFCIKQPAFWQAVFIAAMLHYYRHSRPAKRFNIPAKRPPA